MRSAAVLLVLALTAGSAVGADATFTKKPAVTADDGKVTVAFAVSGPTDVEVAILDGDGRVVRHLAAGVVGRETAALPLKAGSLAQVLTWDYTDDLGRPVFPSPLMGEGTGGGGQDPSPPTPTLPRKGGGGRRGGPFRVRVRIGMHVTFGRTVGQNPYVVDTVRGIATDSKGRLYLLSQSYRGGGGPLYIQVFDSRGKYLRTIMPYSNTLPRDAVAGFGLINTGAAGVTPRNYQGVWPQIYPLSNLLLQPRVSATGHLVFCDGASLLRIDARGAAVNGFKGVALWPAAKPKFHYNRAGPLFVALTADAHKLYISGPYANLKSRYTNDAMRAAWPKGRVYVLDLVKGGGAKPFVTVDVSRDRDLEVPDGAKTLRRAAHGPVHDVATDATGRVYVCDRANDLVRVFTPEAKQVGAIPVRQPHLVSVHPTSGEVFVITMRPLAYRRFETRLFRFAGWKARKASAEMRLPEACGRPTMALAAGPGRPVIWLTGVAGSQVWRVEAAEDAFTLAGKLPVSSSGDMWGADRITVDYETDDVYVNDGWSSLARYNGVTGKGGVVADARALTGVWERDTNQRTNLSALDMTVGPDGFVYLRNGPRYSGPITRWTRDLKPAPFAATNTHVFRRYIYGRYGAGYGERGLDVHPDGRVFIMSMYNWAKYFVHVFKPDGTPANSGRLAGQTRAYNGLNADITSGLVGPLTGRCGGLEVDAAGYVYAGIQLTPDGAAPPEGFEKDPAYRRLCGAIYKFKPTGGGVVSGAKPGVEGVKAGRSFVEGAVRAYPDFGPFSGGYGSQCACRSGRFDLDPFGRLYIPNAVRFSVGVVDNAGNPILRFGRYGNPDDKGAGADIPLGWPIGVGVSQKHIYVSDMLDKRVVRADVSYAATETAAVPGMPLKMAGQGVGANIRELADPSPLDRASAVEALVRVGPKAVGELAVAYGRPKANRDLIRLAVARIRANEVWTEAVTLSPALDKPWLKRALVLALTRRNELPTVEDARVNLLHLTRVVAAWPATEVEAVATRSLADKSPRVRLAALWAINRDDVTDVTVTLAKATLADKNESVRLLAAVLLFDRGHGDGLAVILDGPLSENQWVLDLSRPAATEEVVREGGPKYLKYPVGKREMDLAVKLLNHEYNNMRWVGAGILMLSGQPGADQALADRLPDETISFVRRRIILGLKTMRGRAGVPPLLADVASGPGSRKKGTGWSAAEALADIGDPDSIRGLIDLLDQPKSRDLALFALSRAFDGAVTTGTEYRLIPDAETGLARVSIRVLPPPADRKTAWQAWWKAHQGDYKWDPKAHPLRPASEPDTP